MTLARAAARPAFLALALAGAVAFGAPAVAGPVAKTADAARDAVDPECDAEKALKGAAMKAAVGVGNRCGAAETARDMAGVDGKADDLKDGVEDLGGGKKKDEGVLDKAADAVRKDDR